MHDDDTAGGNAFITLYQCYVWNECEKNRTLALTSTESLAVGPGTVDQKNPLQSGSSKMKGRMRVSRRTQFNTET